MQRPQGISAPSLDAPCEGDVAARLSAGLKRLAVLRARSHGDWSDGPSTLLDVANTDMPAGDILCSAEDTAFRAVAPTLVLTPMRAPPLPLRGRFTDTLDTVGAAAEERIDRSWLDLVETAAPIASALPTLIRLSFSAPPPPLEAAPAPPVDDRERDDRELDPLSFAPFGAAPGAMALAALTVVGVTPPPSPGPGPAAIDNRPEDLLCATPGLRALFALAAPLPVADRIATADVAQAPSVEETPTHLAVGAFPLPFAEAPAEVCPIVPPHAQRPDEQPPHLAVGAFPLTLIEPQAPPSPPAARAALDDADAEIDIAFGASPSLAALLDTAPPCDSAEPAVHAFDPQSLIDDALADAFEALLCAPEAIDPFEAAWTPDVVAATDAAPLEALEAQFWDLPRHVPCVEPFLLSPNHEIAVRLTRALRLRANMLEARAFADTAAFGFLRTETDVQAFWFLADALHDAASLSAGDADVDASFADWRVNDDGLLVVIAPNNAHPKRPPPLISEAELDALFAHVDDAQSRIVLDDLGDDPAWNETFWCDVDTYLQHVSETMDPALLDTGDRCGSAVLDDIEVRAFTAPEPTPIATYFWMPGDDFEMAVAGDGRDLFIVGANETPAVVLIEDGSSYAMRTGKAARADEVVVSLSFDAWRYIDAMQWRRLATLSGIATIRVEQNASGSRHAVVAGAFFATALDDDGVRLVRSTDGGDVDYPVTRLGGMALNGDWGLADAAA